MTTIPVETIPRLFDTQDKLEHFFAYFILSILIMLSFSIQSRFLSIRRNAVLVSVIAIFLYASIDEIHQMIVPGRYCDVYDWLFDIVGGISGILIISYFSKKYDLVAKK
jgi:VanZ family protein